MVFQINKCEIKVEQLSLSKLQRMKTEKSVPTVKLNTCRLSESYLADALCCEEKLCGMSSRRCFDIIGAHVVG